MAVTQMKFEVSTADKKVVTVTIANQKIVVNGKDVYSMKALRYIAEDIKNLVNENVISVSISSNYSTLLKAYPVLRVTGEISTVIQTYYNDGAISEEYIFSDGKCMLYNGEEIPAGVTMTTVVRNYIEGLFFPQE